MSRKKKVSRRKSKSAEPKVNRISMTNFFNRCINLGILKDYEVKPLRVFFTQRDLKEEEDLETYTKMLEKY
jgi:hypothetical protein